MTQNFKRKQEDFVCDNCKNNVDGDGYTNHCPECLWSKHVDINPGDRAGGCGGIMEPVCVEKEKEEHVLTHKCISCGHVKRNKMERNDNFDVAVKI